MSSDNASVSPLAADQERLLQAALTTGFSTASIPIAVLESPDTRPPPQETSETQAAPAESAGTTVPRDGHDEWRDEYESNLSRWKHENATQREKAERVRREWEEREARGEVVSTTTEGDDEALGAHLAKVQSKLEEGGWEKVDQGHHDPQVVEGSHNFLQSTLPGTNPSPSAAAQAGPGRPDEEHSARLHDRTSSNSPVSRWDSMPSSLTSSYPSLSFPDSSKLFTDPRHHHGPPAPQDHRRSQDSHQPPNPPASHSVFDSSLSTKTRVIALLGSLTINLVLPFVNGVMLGFGEIFSENVLFRWFGWRKTLGRSSVASVGLRR